MEMERAMGFAPTTFSLATRHSTAELRPRQKRLYPLLVDPASQNLKLPLVVT